MAWKWTDPSGREDEDPIGVLFSARIRRGKLSRVTATELEDSATTRIPLGRKRVRENPPTTERDVIHPVLRQWLDERDPDDVEEILVCAIDEVGVPRFPEPVVDEPRTSPRNQELLRRAAAVVEELQARRAESQDLLTSWIEESGGKVIERFWIMNGVLAETPLRAVRELARRPEVIAIDPRYSGEEPPQDEVDDARALIDSDPYFNLGQTGGFIGLLDTGVRFTHTLVSNPSNIDFRRDCVNGGSNCNTGSSLNTTDNFWNHGTCSAAIITGNANQGNDFRGVTDITLDSFQVYTNSGLDDAAAVRAFQVAVSVLDRVIVAEMQGLGDHLSSIAQAADGAFDAGAVIVAANGNFGPDEKTVRCPANAHRVIGVGAVDVQTQVQYQGQGRGPTADSRFKPDVQAPTNTETASNASDAARKTFGGTSGATPYASGAAALLRNWLRSGSGSIDPGQVYAQLIVSGQDPYPFDNTTGAGLLRMPTNGWAWWGKVQVSHKTSVEIPISITSAQGLEAALWWPELGIRILGFTFDPHNDIDLAIVDPSGNVRASSISINSVYERARVSGSISSGTWKIRMSGFNVPFAPQTVYWSAHTRA